MKPKLVKTIIYIMLAIAVSIMMFTFISDRNSVFFVSYGFLTAAILIQILPVFIMEKMKETVNKISIYTTSVLYVILQTVISIASLIIKPDTCKYTVALSCVIMILYFIINITMIVFTANGSKLKRKETEKRFFIDNIVCDLENTKINIYDKELLDSLNYLIEETRFSDSISSEKLNALEIKILDAVADFQSMVMSRKINESKEKCDQIFKLIQERNLKSKLYK